MIQWLRKKLEDLIPILFILAIVIGVIIIGIWCAIAKISFVYFLLDCIVLVIACIVTYGYLATVICIANSTEENTELLKRTNSLLSEIKSYADTVKNKLYVLDEISSKLDSVDAAEKSSASPSESKTETFDTVCMNGKMLAVKDDAAGKFFCPKCYAPVVETDFYCSNCNTKL